MTTTGAIARERFAWTLLVTNGTILEFPPELYVDQTMAIREARRWASILSMGDTRLIRQPFDGRWEVGHRDVRLVGVEVPSRWTGHDPWVGTHWTHHGYPDPEAILLPGEREAREWARTPLHGVRAVEFIDQGDELVAVFGFGDDEEYSRVTRLKQICLNLL